MKELSLEGSWTLSAGNGKHRVPATVPGDNYSALIESGVIPHPYPGKNELDVQWVAREEWTFSRSFELPEELHAESSVVLYCGSLDTCAEVFINGESVGSSCNMFVPFSREVKKELKPGRNEIELRFRSPEKAAAEEAGRMPYEIPYAVFPVQSPHRNLLRKTQCNGGWDWGPCLMVSGIYGEVVLRAFDTAMIEYVHTNPVRQDDERWELEVISELFSPAGGTTPLTVSIDGLGIRHEETVSLVAGKNLVKTRLQVEAPELWWPSGYGEQPLYRLEVETADDRREKRIGFRTLEVIAEDDEVGKSMTFRVNGKDIFCKGANWIPSDALPRLQTEEKTRDLLESAKEANMNMIRVWGGGQYEADFFYDICDELGLLIWHDFMFACAMYPATKDFLAEAERETVHQVKRLKDHPSIALWCGNNENLGALTWFDVSRKNRDRYLVDYDRLYEGTIGNTVESLDPQRTYWPSSPAAGRQDYSDNWHTDGRGDMHFWSVWHEGKPFETYREITPRFCSEFGFQSFPSLETVKTYADPAQYNPTSPAMEHHQKNPRGNTIIVETMCRYFRFPEGFENFLYLSQVQQALAIRTAVEYWRSLRPICMGTLFWQLNDNWPVSSWSSVEYGGKWKVLQYAARRFFAPLMVFAYPKNGRIRVWGVNDGRDSADGTLTVAFIDFSGKTHREEKQRLSVHAESAVELASFPFEELPFDPEEGFIALRFETAGGTVVKNTFFTAPPKACALQEAEISASVAERAGAARRDTAPEHETVTVTLTATAPAFHVVLDTAGIPGVFSDNDLTLLPGEPLTLTFTLKGTLPSGETPLKEQIAENLKVFDLRSSYR